MKNNAYFDLYIDEGLDYSVYLGLERIQRDDVGTETITPVDLSDIEDVTAQVRSDFDTTGAPLITFQVEVTNPEGGEIFLYAPGSSTSNLELDPTLPVVHLGYYDIILHSKSGAKSKLVSGKVMINQTITVSNSTASNG